MADDTLSRLSAASGDARMTRHRIDASAEAAAEPAERRRAGRPQDVSPALIPLLRASELANLETKGPDRQADAPLPAPDDLRAMTGIAASVALSLLLWIGVALLARL